MAPMAVLNGRAITVAGNIRRAATNANLDTSQRAGADQCAKYLTNKRAHLYYTTALANGWPIVTGVIEGACRHLVKDRVDITGARWGLPGAETILKLRALTSNGDFDTYWHCHLAHSVIGGRGGVLGACGIRLARLRNRLPQTSRTHSTLGLRD